jgi:hypothetical protein
MMRAAPNLFAAMKRLVAPCLVAAALAPLPVQMAAAQDRPVQDGPVQERTVQGFARLFSNDALGDGHDRWRSGSYMVSQLRAPQWHGTLPTRFGEVLEYRFRTEIIAPASLTNPGPGDRRYAGVVSFGLHSHFALGASEARLGGELVFTGPQTGVGAFQREAHELFGIAPPRVLGTQIPNHVYPTLSAELGRSFRIGRATSLRPFIEAQAGVETLARIGADLTFGAGHDGALMLRDTVTGQRVEGIRGQWTPGLTFTLGGDLAHVADSRYLPSGGAAALSDSRARLRAGLQWRGEKSEVFYGLTWLGREFDTQAEDQLIGSLRLRLRF